MSDNNNQQKAEGAPELQSINDSITALRKTLSEEADKGAGELREFGRNLQENSDAVLAETKNTLQKMQELFDSYMTLQGNLDAKDAEIKRLKKGYDAEIFRRFLRRFIRVDEAARELMEDGAMSESARKGFRQIRELFGDALDECGVEKFSPEIGKDHRTEFGVADRPEKEPTADARQDHKIAAVLAEGYVLKSLDGGRDPVVKAKVKIFKHQKEG
ncbi:MAG: hypothetical protein ACR2QC_02395 [Gammaproteobacteria bacterium]